MWGRRGKRRARLTKQLSLGLLQDAMGRAEQQQEEEAAQAAENAGWAETAPYPGSVPPQAAPPEGAGLQATDVPVDNSTAPPAGDPVPPPQRQRRAERTGKSTCHGSLG